MTTSLSRAAYSDCYAYFDKALTTKLGIRIRVKDAGAAKHLRSRLHTARVNSRREAMDIYAEDHPMHGISPYDNLIVRVKSKDKPGQSIAWYVFIEPRIEVDAVEEIAAE